jgi:hypothetical protein
MKNPKYPPREKTPEQKAQLELAYELGVKAAKEGRAINDYLPEFWQIFQFKFKVAQSLLLAKYFTGHRLTTEALENNSSQSKP